MASSGLSENKDLGRWGAQSRGLIEPGLSHSWDACVRTSDLRTRNEGLGDIKYETRGRVGQGR